MKNKITNEEKAREIAARNAYYYEDEESSEVECEQSAFEMAEWKDEQFKEYIKSKFLQCKNNTANVPLKAGLFDEIIKEILNVEL